MNTLNGGFYNNNAGLSATPSLSQVLQSLSSGYNFGSPGAIQPYLQMLEQMYQAGQLSPNLYNLVTEYTGGYPFSEYAPYASPGYEAYSNAPYGNYGNYGNYGTYSNYAPYSNYAQYAPYSEYNAYSPYQGYNQYSNYAQYGNYAPYGNYGAYGNYGPYSNYGTYGYYGPYGNYGKEGVLPIPYGNSYWFAPYARTTGSRIPTTNTYQMDLLSELFPHIQQQAAKEYTPTLEGLGTRPGAAYLTRAQLENRQPAQAFKQRA